MAPSKKLRKGTKDWRKNIDLTPIEDVLEEKRVEEISGVNLKSDQDLFLIDKQGQTSIKKKLKEKKIPLVDQILNQRSAIPSLGVLPTTQFKKIPKKLLKKALEHKKEKSNQLKSCLDIWSTDMQPSVKPPKTLKLEPEAKLVIPAVEVDHPGTSYHPDPEKHQEAMLLAAQVEIEKMEKEKKIQEKKIQVKQIIKNSKKDAHITMDLDFDDEIEETAEAEEQTVEKVKVETKRKTKKDRLKEKRRKMEEQIRLKKLEQKQKRMESQIKQEPVNEEPKEEAAKKEKIVKIKKLSKYKYKPLPMAIQTPDELASSLRTLKPESNLFKERFNQLQKRNIIETRIPVTFKRRYKEKEYEKRDYKNYK